MNVTNQIRKIYEDHPYPAIDRRRRGTVWCLPPRDWIESVWRPATPPRRILSAGCGTGNEAFALRKQFPNAEIVGVDFSASSLAIARRLQRAQGLRGIRFVEGNLSDPRLAKQLGGSIDFISCHGVLAYIARREVALQTFADLLTADGAIYVGLNGAAHFSTRWRSALAEFGFDADAAMPDDERLPAIVELLDAMTQDGVAPVSKREASFLPTDLFGPLIRTTSLREFLAECEPIGLRFLGSHDKRAPLRRAVDGEYYRTLMPGTRATVALIMDAIQPSGFHHLHLSKRPQVEVPWDSPDELAEWAPALASHAAMLGVAAGAKRSAAMRRVKLQSVPMNIEVELRSPAWVIRVLQQADGKHALGALVREHDGSLRSTALRDHLYLLHQLYLLEMIPPQP